MRPVVYTFRLPQTGRTTDYDRVGSEEDPLWTRLVSLGVRAPTVTTILDLSPVVSHGG